MNRAPSNNSSPTHDRFLALAESTAIGASCSSLESTAGMALNLSGEERAELDRIVIDERARIGRMWFPVFQDPQDETTYVHEAMFPKIRLRIVLCYFICVAAVLGHTTVTLVSHGFAAMTFHHVFGLTSQLIICQLLLLTLYIQASVSDSILALFASMMQLSLYWRNSWRMGLFVAGDGQYFRPDANLIDFMNEEIELILLSCGWLTVFCHKFPIRSNRSLVMVLLSSMYAMFSTINMAPGGFHITHPVLLVVTYFMTWITGTATERHMRIVWFTQKQMERRVSKLETLVDSLQVVDCTYAADEKTALDLLEEGVAHGNDEEIASAWEKLRVLNWMQDAIIARVKQVEKEQSENGGISVAYMISADFFELAKVKSGKQQPTFRCLKHPFFLGDDPLGKGTLCPRDHKLGCALVDFLPRINRGRCTHFLSWSWDYKISLVQEALQMWMARRFQDDERYTFLFCCFFCNNQYRVLLDAQGNGAKDLELVFESRLINIGRMVALLDDWKDSMYTSRIWTIFEQYTAAKLHIPVEIILGKTSSLSLIAEIENGVVGITHVVDAFMKVDSRRARATYQEDEKKVKKMIQQSIGFEQVNRAVCISMTTWVASEVRAYFDKMTNDDELQHLRARALELESAASPGNQATTRDMSVARSEGVSAMNCDTVSDTTGSWWMSSTGSRWESAGDEENVMAL